VIEHKKTSSIIMHTDRNTLKRVSWRPKADVRMVRGAPGHRVGVRRFVDEEIRPHIDDIEHHGVPPFDILRKMYGRSDCARWPGELQAPARAQDLRRRAVGRTPGRLGPVGAADLDDRALSRQPGSGDVARRFDGPHAGTINKLGTPAQMQRWGLDS